MQIHFNGTNFFNARLTQLAFSVWPVAKPVVGEMEMHSVANLATLQTSLATFFPLFKKAPSDKSLWFAQILFSYWDTLVLLAVPAHAHTSRLSSLSASALFSSGGGRSAFS